MNLLSARKVETTSPQAEPYWLKDGGSLFLYITPNGSKLWRYRYRLGGKPAIYAIGKYPQVSLETARAEREHARQLVKKGVHPVVQKRVSISAQLEKHEHTFEPVAREWMASNAQWSEGYADQVKRTLEREVFPKVGKLPISSIRTAHLRPVVKHIAERGAPTVAILVRQWCSQIFAYAAGRSYVTVTRQHC